MSDVKISEMGDTGIKNRGLIKRILNIVSNIAIHTPYTEKGKLGLDEYIRDTCIEALTWCLNSEMDREIEEAITLVKTSRVLADIVRTLSNMVENKIKEEVQSCPHLSMILSEHSDVASSMKLSTVVRYLKAGKVCERFTGFVCSSAFKNAEVMGTCISEVLTKFEAEEKMIAYSCDGAVLSTAQLQILIDREERAKPCCFFVPCHFHSLDAVLEQSLSQHPRGAYFFKMLESTKNFLRKPRIFLGFAEFDHQAADLDLSVGNWNFAVAFRHRRKRVADFLKSVVQHQKKWIAEDVTMAMGLYKMLEEFETIFMLEVLTTLFNRIEMFARSLNDPSPEDMSYCFSLESLLFFLNNVGLKEFPRLWSQSCVEKCNHPSDYVTVDQFSEGLIKDGVQKSCHKLFEHVMVSVAEEIKVRFGSLEKLSFFQLLNPKRNARFEDSKLVDDLTKIYGENNFDKAQLLKELKATKSMIGGKQIHKTLEILSSEKLRDSFGNVRKLAEIILTMPCKADCVEEDSADSSDIAAGCDLEDEISLKPISVKCNSTKLEVLNFWSALITENEEITLDWSVVCIEKDILKGLKYKENFFDEFLSSFQTSDDTLLLS